MSFANLSRIGLDKPLRLLLAMVLEPMFRKGLNKAFGRYTR